MLPLLAALALQDAPRVDVTQEVIYEANFRATGPTHDFAALELRLPKLKALGVTTVWLMPIHPVGRLRSAGGLGSPYAVADYTKVNPEFGGMTGFRRFLRKAHDQGTKVILDWVANHTAWDHPWLSQHRDWYVQDAKGEVVIPPGTNWQDVAELDYRSRPLREAMVAAMRFWVGQGIDGFRCDFAEGVPTDFWKDAVSRLRASTSRPLLMLAEATKPELYNAGFDLTYDWELFGLLKDICAERKPASDFVPALLRRKRPTLRFVTNHDEYAWSGSPQEQFGSNEAAQAAFSALALAPGGTPLLCTGQEAGVIDRIPFFTRSDHALDASPAVQSSIREALRERRANPKGASLHDFSTQHVVCFVLKTPRSVTTVAVNLSPRPQKTLLPTDETPSRPLKPWHTVVQRTNG